MQWVCARADVAPACIQLCKETAQLEWCGWSTADLISQCGMRCSSNNHQNPATGGASVTPAADEYRRNAMGECRDGNDSKD